MPKFSLTINTDSPDEIRSILASLAGSTVSVVNFPTNAVALPAPTLSHEDDENGPVNTNAPALDATGLAWDERIHAKSKGQNKDGSWKKARGVSDGLIAAVEAELRARNASPIPAGMPAPFPHPAAPVQPPFNSPQAPIAPVQAVQPAHTPAQPSYPVHAPTPAQAAPIQQQPQPSGLDFNSLMLGLQRAMQAGRIDVNGLGAIVQEINTAWQTGLTAITDLAQHPHMIGWAIDLLKSRQIWVD